MYRGVLYRIVVMLLNRCFDIEVYDVTLFCNCRPRSRRCSWMDFSQVLITAAKGFKLSVVAGV